MHLDIVEALQKGFERTFEKNGLMIAGLLFITSLISSVLSATAVKGAPAQYQSGSASAGALALPMSPTIAGILLIPATIISAIVGIVAIRTFVSDEKETIPEEFYKRNLISALLNMAAGGLVFGIVLLAAIGIPVLPGAILALTGISGAGLILTGIGALIGTPIMIYIALSLYFWTFYVIVEDQNFIEGFKSSWDLTKEHKIGLLVLAIAIFIVNIALNLLSAAPNIAGLTVVSWVLGLIVGALLSAFSTATLAQAYRQLK